VQPTVISSHTSRTPFVAAGAVTGIGSLPLTSITSAILSVAEFSPEVPFWPQLPQLSERESIVGQGLGVVEELIEPRNEGYGELKGRPIVTDGSRLYFQNQGHAVEMSVKGGPTTPLRASVSGMNILDISPDASEMLALKPDPTDETARGSIWSVPVLGGYPRIVRSQIARSAHWSPDGRSIVYVDLKSVYPRR